MIYTDFKEFLQTHRAKVEALEIEMGDAWWQANLATTEENDARAASAQKALTGAYADPEPFAYLRRLDHATLSADEARQALILLNQFMGNQMDKDTISEIVDTERRAESKYNGFRPLFHGEPASDNTLRDILRMSNNSEERREAWEATKQIGQEVEADVLHLVRLRNREAHRLGFSNFYEMSLQIQEQNVGDLFTLVDRLVEQTQPVWDAYKADLDASLARQFGVDVDALRPWHYSDPFFQEAPPGEVDFDRFYQGKNLETLTQDVFAAVGLEVQDVLQRSDLYERENKCQHAFCIHVGRGPDVRVLCNCTDSERWMGTMLHEFGHGVYDKYLGDDLPFFLREVAHTSTTEAMAMLFGRLSRSAAFLTRYVGVSRDEASSVADAGRKEASIQLLILSRWVPVMMHFERAMYENPEQDLNRLWWQIVGKFQNVHAPEGRDAPDWAAKLHIALAPVYYHNYLLGEMMASQIQNTLTGTVLAGTANVEDALISSPEVGAYLRSEIFARGARLPWNQLIEAATGEPLNPAHFVGHLQA